MSEWQVSPLVGNMKLNEMLINTHGKRFRNPVMPLNAINEDVWESQLLNIK